MTLGRLEIKETPGASLPGALETTHLDDLMVPEVTSGTPLFDAAKLYAEAGFYVVPLKHQSKNPGSILGGGWETRSSRDIEDLDHWFGPLGAAKGIGLHCGRSGAVMIDVDDPDVITEDHPLYGPLFVDTPPWQSTRSNRARQGHYIFAQPAGRNIGNSKGRLWGGWGEVRGLNGIIVVAPSKHEKSLDGGLYRWEATGAVPVLPHAVAELLPDATPGSPYHCDSEHLRAFFESTDGVGSHPHLFLEVLRCVERWHNDGQARHDTHLKALCMAYRDALAGCYPAEFATTHLRAWFDAATAGDSNDRSAEADRNELWAFSQALTDSPAGHFIFKNNRLPSLGELR